MEKFKQIQNRLNNLNVQDQSEGPNKLKIKQLQTMMGRLTASLEEDDITRQYKLNEMLEKVRKIESAIKEADQQASIKCIFHLYQIEAALQSTLNRVQKGMKKKLQKFSKSKKQADKDFQSSLNNYLIELAGFKSKMSHSCLTSIGMLKQKQTEIEETHKSHIESNAVTKQILKKIYQQYTGQLDELNRLITEEEAQRRTEEEILLQRLEKMYDKMGREVSQIRKQREKSQGEMIGLLEKVVDRVRSQVVKM